jgi:transcriptional regulator with XRE-family HTH domain
MPADRADLGDAISLFRKRVGFTQAGLAEQVGVTQTQVSRWERGTQVPSLAIIEELEALFNIKPGTLLVEGGYVDSGITDVEMAIRQDKRINPQERAIVAEFYQVALDRAEAVHPRRRV